MSVSINNNYNSTLNASSTYNGNYDNNILNYSDYYIEIKCSTNCSITVYQTNDTLQPPVVTQYNYSQGDSRCITNTIVCSNIKFSVTNLSSTQGTLNFSVAYK